MSQTEPAIPVHKDVYPAIAPSIYSPDEFKDKVVIVTGAGSGIGKETALAFSQLGAKVVFTDWREDAAKQAVEEAETFANPTLAVQGDVTKMEDTERLVNTVLKEFGQVDVAVFAAGYGMFDKFAISREKDWWGLIETNLKGPTDLTRLILPSMIKRNTGKLIYISSRVYSINDRLTTRPGSRITLSLRLTAFRKRD
jgi:NADP-dependent 3-hydroxy acid dehydrogenase YdfG